MIRWTGNRVELKLESIEIGTVDQGNGGNSAWLQRENVSTPDVGNNKFYTSADGTSTFTGAWYDTRDPGNPTQRKVAAQEVILASNVASGLGGTFVFEYTHDNAGSPSLPPDISETRTITDFATVRDFPLQNAGDYFRVKFTPSRALTGSENVVVSTTEWFITPPHFVRLANQQIEEANAAMSQTFAYLKAFDPLTGKSVNIRPTPNEALRVSDDSAYTTPSGSRFTESIRDDISHKFTSENVATEILKLRNFSNGGTVTADTVNGLAVFSTGATAGNTAVFFSAKNAVYETGHGIVGEQTIILQSLPTGNAFVEWGYASTDLNNGTGYGVDAVGIYTFRRKNGVYEQKTYQTNWNRDKCNGLIPSLFKRGGLVVTLNPLTDNLYRVQYEWLGADGHNYLIKSPTLNFLSVNVDEYANANGGSSLPSPKLPLHIRVCNDTISGGNLVVKSGSWRGGIFTSKTVGTGINPSGDFVDIQVQGTDPGNTSTTPLLANTGTLQNPSIGSVFRGIWFNWQANYVKSIIDLTSDVAGTLLIDLSEKSAPVNGDESSVDDSITYVFDPNISPLFRKHTPVQAKWYRLRYVNGIAAQAEFNLDAALLTNDPGSQSQQLSYLPTKQLMGDIVRNVPAIGDGTGNAYHELPVDTSGIPTTHITKIDDDILLRPLPNWQVRQFTIGATPQQLNLVPLTGVRSAQVKNHDPNNPLYINSTNLVSDSNGELISPLASSSQLTGTGPIWVMTPGGVQSTLDRDAGAASGTATNPANAEHNDGTYATIGATGQTIILDTFTAGTVNALQSVRIGLDGHKNPSPSTETVGFVDVVTGTAGNVGSVVSGSVTANANHFYIVAISRKNTSAAITSVVGMGLTWTLLDDVANGTDTRISVYYSTGIGATSGAVTATFSQTATNAVISVSRYSNVNLSSPITNHSTNTGTTTSISGSITTTNLGMIVVMSSDQNRSMTAGAGFTVRNDTSSGTGGTTASEATETAAATGGSNTYAATLSGNANWSAVVVALEPQVTIAPTILVQYKLSGVLGATSGTLILSSTTDTTQFVNISTDRAWGISDIPNVQIIATGTITTATALVDYFFIELVDTTGNTVRCSLKEIAST